MKNFLWMVLIAVMVYSVTAVATARTTDAERRACERSNIHRRDLYMNGLQNIWMNRALIIAIDNKDVQQVLADDTRQRRRSLLRLTVAPESGAPWRIDCYEEFPDPVPWP